MVFTTCPMPVGGVRVKKTVFTICDHCSPQFRVGRAQRFLRMTRRISLTSCVLPVSWAALKCCRTIESLECVLFLRNGNSKRTLAAGGYRLAGEAPRCKGRGLWKPYLQATHHDSPRHATLRPGAGVQNPLDRLRHRVARKCISRLAGPSSKRDC